MIRYYYLYILSIFFINYSYTQNSNDGNIKDEYRNKCYFNITRFSYIYVTNIRQDVFVPGEGGFSRDLPDDDAQAFGLQTINGYFLNPHLSVGIGIGLDGYTNPNVNTFPVFIDVRAYLDDDYNSLFIYLDAGTLTNAGGAFRRGGIYNIGAGYKVFLGQKSRIALLPEIGFAAKSVSLTGEKVKTSDDTLFLGGIQFSLGIIF